MFVARSRQCSPTTLTAFRVSLCGARSVLEPCKHTVPDKSAGLRIADVLEPRPERWTGLGVLAGAALAFVWAWTVVSLGAP